MRSFLEVNFSVLEKNLSFLRSISRARKVLIPVKANAYGLGAVEISSFLKDKVDYLGFAVIEEALEVKYAQKFTCNEVPGVDESISPSFLLLGQAFGEDIKKAIGNGVELTVSDVDFLREAESYARKLGKPALIHLKFDTGMGRIGFPVYERGIEKAYEFLEEALRSKYVVVRGIYTHFPDAENDPDFTSHQFEVFGKIVERARSVKPSIIAHCANSAATLLESKYHLDMIRPGIAFYGSLPVADLSHPGLGKFADRIKPSVRWFAPITYLKDVPPGTTISYGRTYTAKNRERIATVSVGYHDGYARIMSGKAYVVCGGVKCPVVGRITMDQILIRIPDALKDRVKVGESVLLLGEDEQNSENSIRIEKMASWSETCTHEVIARIGERVQRRYV